MLFRSRIELGEIEAALQSHSAIGQAAVIVRNDGQADDRQTDDRQKLVGYYTLATSYHDSSDVFVPSVRELREHLQLSLPEYMIPSAFVLMDKLPLTASGKLDRRALPVPETDYLGVSSSYIPPRTPLEEKLEIGRAHV